MLDVLHYWLETELLLLSLPSPMPMLLPGCSGIAALFSCGVLHPLLYCLVSLPRHQHPLMAGTARGKATYFAELFPLKQPVSSCSCGFPHPYHNNEECVLMGKCRV